MGSRKAWAIFWDSISFEKNKGEERRRYVDICVWVCKYVCMCTCIGMHIWIHTYSIHPNGGLWTNIRPYFKTQGCHLRENKREKQREFPGTLGLSCLTPVLRGWCVPYPWLSWILSVDLPARPQSRPCLRNFPFHGAILYVFQLPYSLWARACTNMHPGICPHVRVHMFMHMHAHLCSCMYGG